jgi:TonB family protein
MFARALRLAALFTIATAALSAQEGRKIEKRVVPIYPTIARDHQVRGEVKLAVDVAADGSVHKATVLGGHPLLTQAAVAAVQQWRFEPGAAGTVPVTVDFK